MGTIKTRPVNQCDGCRAKRPLDQDGNHRMSDGEYPDKMSCTAEKYVRPPYPWCIGAPTKAHCIQLGYCPRGTSCGD